LSFSFEKFCPSFLFEGGGTQKKPLGAFCFGLFSGGRFFPFFFLRGGGGLGGGGKTLGLFFTGGFLGWCSWGIVGGVSLFFFLGKRLCFLKGVFSRVFKEELWGGLGDSVSCFLKVLIFFFEGAERTLGGAFFLGFFVGGGGGSFFFRWGLGEFLEGVVGFLVVFRLFFLGGGFFFFGRGVEGGKGCKSFFACGVFFGGKVFFFLGFFFEGGVWGFFFLFLVWAFLLVVFFFLGFSFWGSLGEVLVCFGVFFVGWLSLRGFWGVGFGGGVRRGRSRSCWVGGGFLFFPQGFFLGWGWGLGGKTCSLV